MFVIVSFLLPVASCMFRIPPFIITISLRKKDVQCTMNPRRFQVTGATVCYVSIVAGGATGAVCGVQRLAKGVHFNSHAVCSFHAYVIACSLFFLFFSVLKPWELYYVQSRRRCCAVRCVLLHVRIFFRVYDACVYVEVL